VNALLEKALTEVAALPDAAQETIASLILKELKAVRDDHQSLRPWEVAEDDIAALETPLASGEGGAFDHEWRS